ncbi:MAG: hypothetical protein AAB655_01085, partial [Patescibacteria group bacterium]
MKNATLEQGMKVQKMIVDKGTLDEQLQWTLESGALSDLLDANPDGFDREAFRKFLGLKPLKLPLLTPVGTVTVAATTTSFVAKDRFVVNTKQNAPVKIAYLWDDFRAWFTDKVEQPFEGSTLKYGKLSRSSVDGSIIAELGGEEKAETTLAEIFSLMAAQMAAQPSGESGPLLTNGYANIFYVRDAKGVLRAV